MKKIGITESGEISFNLDAFDRLQSANVIITKRLTPQLIEKLIENKDRIILHLTVTGMGGSKIEPFVPAKEVNHSNFTKLIEGGFPIKQTVLRIDPIIPTRKGIETALSVIELFGNSGIKRVRFSSMDNYKHLKERFDNVDVKLPYETFHAKSVDIKRLFTELLNSCSEYGMWLESCAENIIPTEHQCGCILQKDIDLLGLTYEIELIGSSEQRRNCMCPANKIELIKGKPHRCESKCLYCFWRD